MTNGKRIKDFIRQVFLRCGVDIRRARKEPAFTIHTIEPINLLPLAISDVLLRFAAAGREFSDFSFVQVGANDGQACDPIRRFVLKYGFRGVLIEPQPDVFERLKANYKGTPNLRFANVAISRSPGTATLYRFKGGQGLPPEADILASFSRETLVNNFHNIKGEIEELHIPTMTFPQLIKEYGLEKVDLLQIDTEGYDYEIIKALGDSTLRPSIISFEQGFLPGHVQNECFAYLNSLGYKVTRIDDTDTVAYLEPPEQSLVQREWKDA